MKESKKVEIPKLDEKICHRIYYPKPPLGTFPYDLRAIERIKELTEAINRYLDFDPLNLGFIEKWAREIIYQCELVYKLEKEK